MAEKGLDEPAAATLLQHTSRIIAVQMAQRGGGARMASGQTNAAQRGW
jgi:hypothetical protein